MVETVTNRVNALRVAKQITQEELAKAVGVTRQTIIAIEKGNYVPSVLLSLKIAQYLNRSVEEIFKITYAKK